MPRRTLRVLKACWAALAWILFLTGVIGCGGEVARPAQPDAGGAPRPTFQAYREVLSYHDFADGTTKTAYALTIDASGIIGTSNGEDGQARPAELATFIELATRPETIAAFAATTQCGAIGDGDDVVILTVDSFTTYTRSSTCAGIGDLAGAAKELTDTVIARSRDGGGH